METGKDKRKGKGLVLPGDGNRALGVTNRCRLSVSENRGSYRAKKTIFGLNFGDTLSQNFY